MASHSETRSAAERRSAARHATPRRRARYARYRLSATRGIFATVVVALALGAAVGVRLPLTAEATGASAPRWSEARIEAFAQANAQNYRVPATAAAPTALRDDFTATDMIESLVSSGTNHDWAKLVLLLGDFPMTEQNVTVITRWMRQENYVERWYLRNNPLNNGWGSGGGSGLGSYDSLLIAAENAAESLRENELYSGIAAAFDDGSSSAAVEQAIWASPWASSHYEYGRVWATNPVDVVVAPPGAWGR